MSLSNLRDFFLDIQLTDGVSFKNSLMKKKILAHFADQGNATLADLGNELKLSTPKVNELILELIHVGLVKDYGKINAGVGRKPHIYGLEADSASFVGVDVRQNSVNIGLMNFKRTLIQFEEKVPYVLNDTPESLEHLCSIIEKFIDQPNIQKEKILGIGINLSGRINHRTGHSYSYFHFEEEPLSKVIEKRLGILSYLENDSRAMAYGEFCNGVVDREKNVLFIHLDEGIGMGILIEGKLYYGKSGFAGEFGHIPTFDNEIICHCGKKGCLETEASGRSITRDFIQKIKEGATSIVTHKRTDIEKIQLGDIIDASINDDMLAIEILNEAGLKIGKSIAALINLFNPELIILGGCISYAGDYIKLPIQGAINKYSLSLVNNDTQVKISTAGEQAGVLGACLLVCDKIFH